MLTKYVKQSLLIFPEVVAGKTQGIISYVLWRCKITWCYRWSMIPTTLLTIFFNNVLLLHQIPKLMRKKQLPEIHEHKGQWVNTITIYFLCALFLSAYARFSLNTSEVLQRCYPFFPALYSASDRINSIIQTIMDSHFNMGILSNTNVVCSKTT